MEQFICWSFHEWLEKRNRNGNEEVDNLEYHWVLSIFLVVCVAWYENSFIQKFTALFVIYFLLVDIYNGSEHVKCIFVLKLNCSYFRMIPNKCSNLMTFPTSDLCNICLDAWQWNFSSSSVAYSFLSRKHKSCHANCKTSEFASIVCVADKCRLHNQQNWLISFINIIHMNEAVFKND